MDIADENSTQAGPFLSLIQPSSLGPQPGTARTCVSTSGLHHECLHLDCRHCRLLDDSYPLRLFKKRISVINTVHSVLKMWKTGRNRRECCEAPSHTNVTFTNLTKSLHPKKASLDRQEKRRKEGRSDLSI